MIIMIIAGIAFLVLLTWGLICAPIDSHSRQVDDEAQIAYLKEWREKRGLE